MTNPLYVNDGAWGTGVHRLLVSLEVDGNFWAVQQRLVALEALDLGAGITSVTQSSPTSLTVSLSNGNTYTFTLPSISINSRGEWAPNTPYAVNDLVTVTPLASIYIVAWGHLSGATFDPGANDGLGHAYYKLLFEVPSPGIPTGGTTDQLLAKASNADNDLRWQGSGLPRGGALKNILYKSSGTTDFATAWGTPGAAGIKLSTLGDCSISAPASGNLLSYNGTAWANVSIASAIDLSALGDCTAISSPASGDILRFNGTDWGNVTLASLPAWPPAQVRQATITALGTSGTVSLDPTLGDVFTITPTGAVTLNAASTPAGAHISVVVTTSGTSSYNITPSTNFKSTGALATGTVSGKVFTLNFVSDGVNLNEVARTTAM